MENKKEPIYCVDIILISPKSRGKKERIWHVRDFMVVGNSADLLWENSHHRKKILRKAFATPSKYKAASQDSTISIYKIKYNSFHGWTKNNAGWNCTDWEKPLPLSP
jgi:hypothetical protein